MRELRVISRLFYVHTFMSFSFVCFHLIFSVFHHIFFFLFFSFSSSSYTRISPSVTDPTWPVLIGALEHPAKIYAKHALAVSTAIFAFSFAKRRDAQTQEIKLKTDLQVIYSPILVKCRTSFWFLCPFLLRAHSTLLFLWSSQANKIIALYVCRCDLHFNFERIKRERYQDARWNLSN